jgi:hypothetical protein
MVIFSYGPQKREVGDSKGIFTSKHRSLPAVAFVKAKIWTPHFEA